MREKLEACVTMGDSYGLFKSLEKEKIVEFVNALNKAKEFIELTNRDAFLLDQAEYELRYRN